jgi:hypothetical protein
MKLKINKTYIGLKLTINNKKDQTVLFKGVKRRKKRHTRYKLDHHRRNAPLHQEKDVGHFQWHNMRTFLDVGKHRMLHLKGTDAPHMLKSVFHAPHLFVIYYFNI